VRFITTFRALVDQWIDSAVNEDGTETPSSRYVRGWPKGYPESLFDALHGWLGRNMLKPALMSDGKISILDRRLDLYGLELDTYARETAILLHQRIAQMFRASPTCEMQELQLHSLAPVRASSAYTLSFV
jgi:hypothetical protein